MAHMEKCSFESNDCFNMLPRSLDVLTDLFAVETQVPAPKSAGFRPPPHKAWKTLASLLAASIFRHMVRLQ